MTPNTKAALIVCGLSVAGAASSGGVASIFLAYLAIAAGIFAMLEGK